MNMDEKFLNDYFAEINVELKNKRFVEELKKEFDELNKDKLKDLIENHF